jgi:uncharacterized protein
MHTVWILTLFVAAAAFLGGCKKSAEPEEGGGFGQRLPFQAQPKLQTMKLWLGAEEIVAELALTPEQERTGMMFRTNLDENSGMLFPLPATQQASFWMKNCPLPLSAAYIDPEGTIQEIHDLHSFDTNAVVAASDNIRFVLETSEGWFTKHHIGVGTAVRTEHGPLMKTFFNAKD